MVCRFCEARYLLPLFAVLVYQAAKPACRLACSLVWMSPLCPACSSMAPCCQLCLCLHLLWVPAGAEGAVALDMSKFFDTNYHYMVPELDSSSQPKTDFKLLLDKVETQCAGWGGVGWCGVVKGGGLVPFALQPPLLQLLLAAARV